MFFIVRIYNVSQINGLSPRKSRFTLHEKSIHLAHTIHIYLAHIFLTGWWRIEGQSDADRIKTNLKWHWMNGQPQICYIGLTPSSTAASLQGNSSSLPGYTCVSPSRNACLPNAPSGYSACFLFTRCHVAAASKSTGETAESSISGIQSFQMCSMFYQWGEGKKRIKGEQTMAHCCDVEYNVVVRLWRKSRFLTTLSLTAWWITPSRTASVELIHSLFQVI